jgi:phospholipase D-like protein
MFLGEGIFGFAILALWVWAIFDVITTQESDVQNLPKMIWLLIVLLIPPIGPLAWLLLGRPRSASFRVGSGRPMRSAPEPPPAPLPERWISDEDYHRKREEAIERHQAEREVELRKREEELRRREEEVRRREQDDR